jgi:hypothetical protein
MAAVEGVKIEKATPVPNVPMLGLSTDIPSVSTSELQQYNEASLIKVALLLGIDITLEEKVENSRKELIRRIKHVVKLNREELQNDPLYKPTERAGLLIIKKLSDKSLVIELHDRGFEIMSQNWSEGKLNWEVNDSEGLQVERIYRAPVGINPMGSYYTTPDTYLSEETYTFVAPINKVFKRTFYLVEDRKENVKVFYDINNKVVYPEQYYHEFEIAKNQLKRSSRIAARSITNLKIPLADIISQYLDPE